MVQCRMKEKKKQMDTPMLYDTYREIEREI